MSDTRPSEVLEDIAAHCEPTSEIDPNVRAESLKKLADALMAEHTVSRSTATLEAAISIFEGILRLRSHDQKNRAEALGDLGNALFSYCFFHEEHQSRHTHCLDLLREALQLCPPGHSSRDRALHNLARALLFLDYEQQPGAWDILGESILLNRAALQLRPPGHSEREHSLNNLACGLLRSFEHCGDLDLLAEAIIMHRETLQLRPVGHLLRDTALQNLAIALMTSFEHQGGSETLVEAININRDALQLRPVGHPRRWTALNGLGNALWLSHAPKGFPELLSEPICLFREAVQLVPCTHPDRWMVLSNLARILVASFRHSHDRPVLAEAIALLRESLRLLPGEISQPEVVNGLAEALVASFEEDDNRDHLIEAMELHRQALNLRPPGHSRRMESLQRLGRLLCRRECQSWTEAFTLFREALETCPTGSPDRSDVLSDTSICLLDSGSPFFDIYQGMAHLSQAYADNFSHVNRRLRSAMWDLRRVESAYHVVAASLDPSTLEYCNSRVLALYAQVISLLPRAANFGLDHSTRLQAVTGLDDIARDAAARAILLGREYQALEMLEQGRGVFWAQTLHLRTGAFDGVPQDECDELQRLLRLLDHSASGFESSDQSAEQREPDLERQRRLNDEVEALICKIRGYAGLDRFLLPPTFDALVGALPDGFVVVVNTSKLGHHALLLDRGNRLAASLKLEPPPAGFDCTTLRLHIQREMEGTHDEGTRAMRKDHGRGGPLLDVLTLLWTSIVQPVISRLGLQKNAGRARPRLWWCVTGELGFLPIHAAGNYRDTNPVCVADYVASSYVPTLSSLTKARASWKSIPRMNLAGLLVCEESSDSERARYLPKAAEEVHIVRDCFESAHAQVLNAPSSHMSPSELRLLLNSTPAHILHLACHGIHASDPLRSALVLQNGDLTIQDIMDLHLPNAVLAVLSACQTARGDRNAPDQAIHLVASMLFCGFRSVIGTMWLMHDEDGPKVAQALYEALFRGETLDLDDVPYALDEAVELLRKSGVPAQRWALFMHMGG